MPKVAFASADLLRVFNCNWKQQAFFPVHLHHSLSLSLSPLPRPLPNSLLPPSLYDEQGIRLLTCDWMRWVSRPGTTLADHRGWLGINFFQTIRRVDFVRVTLCISETGEAGRTLLYISPVSGWNRGNDSVPAYRHNFLLLLRSSISIVPPCFGRQIA